MVTNNRLVVDKTGRAFYIRWERWGSDSRLTNAARYAIDRSGLSTGRSAEGYHTFRTRGLADQALTVANAAIEAHKQREQARLLRP